MISPLTIYVLCSTHSLNLVGTSAVDCCQKLVAYFNFLKKIYNFFTTSTHRWQIILSYLKNSKGIKNWSQTHWSARHEDSNCLFTSWNDIKSVLQTINDFDTEKSKTSYEALTRLKHFSCLEICCMNTSWHEVLERFDVIYKNQTIYNNR